MHCYALAHMMQGMMGPLLIVRGGELALALPSGVPCEDMQNGGVGGGGALQTVNLQSSTFVLSSLTITMGDSVQFVNKDGFPHTVTWDTPGSPANSGTIKAAGSPGDTYTTGAMNITGTFNYQCDFHGSPTSGMRGSITVTM